MPELDLTQTALIIKGNNGPAKDVVLLPLNQHSLVYSHINISFGNRSVDIDSESRECTPAAPFAEPELHLRFDGDMKDPSQGWRFGIDSKKQKMCDVLLGEHDEVRRNGPKISAKHFRVYFNFESGMLVLENESQHGTTISIRDEEGKEESLKLMGSGSRSLAATSVTTVIVAGLEFLLYHPTLDGVQKLQHQANWQAFAQKYKAAIPGLGQLTMSSAASTRPPSQRRGWRNGYHMFEEIGRGEYGIVRRAIEYHSGAVYAAKEFFRVKEKQEAQNFSEIATLQRLSHPRIVKFVDLIADHAGLVLVMEFMPLGNLKDQHRRKKISRAESKVVFRQVLEGMAYLHGTKHVHRDIKPENILLKEWNPPIAKLSDFGLTTRDGFLTTECGTKKYAAPEIYLGQYDKSVDIWSAGVSAFDITEGLPEGRESFIHEAWATEVQTRIATVYSAKNDPFLQLLQEMVNLDPKSRPSAEVCLSDRRLGTSPRDNEFDLGRSHDMGGDIPTFRLPSEIIHDTMPATVQGSVSPNYQDETIETCDSESNHRQDAENVTEIREYTIGREKFRECVLKEVTIVMRLTDGWIDFTHLAKASGKPRKWIDKMLKRIPKKTKQVYQHSQRGTLIEPDLAVDLIQEFGLQNPFQLSSGQFTKQHLEQRIEPRPNPVFSGCEVPTGLIGPHLGEPSSDLQSCEQILQSRSFEDALAAWPLEYVSTLNYPPNMNTCVQGQPGEYSDLNALQEFVSIEQQPRRDQRGDQAEGS